MKLDYLLTMDADLLRWKKRGRFFNYRGYKVFYIHEGEGDPILILHGYPFSSYEWDFVFSYLTKEHEVIILDLLGMGFSDKPTDYAYSYNDYIRLVGELLNYLHISSVHIFAHDLGVSIGQELLAGNLINANSFHIKSIAFMNGSLFMDTYKPRFIQRLLSQTPPFIGKLINRFLTKKMIFKSILPLFGKHTKPNSIFLNQQWQVLTYNNGLSITYILGRLIFKKFEYQQRWIYTMQNTTVPICYICGPADPNSGSKMAERYLELIPHPKVYLLKSTIGHWPQVEAPQETCDAYRQFFLSL